MSLTMDEGPFSCPYCSMNVRTRKGLKIHIRKIHIDGGRSRKSIPYSLKPLPERASIEGLYAPYVCVACGFCCTANETLQVHCRSVHGPVEGQQKASFASQRLPSVNSADGKFEYFTNAVKGRLRKSLTSTLPPLCHVGTSKKSAVIYVPIHLTEAESQLLFQLSLNHGALPPPKVQRSRYPQESCHAYPPDQAHLAPACPTASFPTESALRTNNQCQFSENTEPTPVDLGLLNDVLEFACNEPKLPDSPEPQYRTFAVSEDIFEMTEINSDNVEVFEFNADFSLLMGKELSLHDTENSIEIHVTESDGSTTVMTAVKRSDTKLRSVLSMTDTNFVIE